MPPTGDRLRIVQVHPSLRCNLRCLHCYSSSGPTANAGVNPEVLSLAVAHAASEGYNMLSVSGGEPLMYRALSDLLDQAHSRRMLTSVTTNGMPLDARRVAMLVGRADLLAISIDGVPASHDRIRAFPGAFQLMASRLDGVRRSGLSFGFLFTLTRFNLHELDWVARFAVDEGAKLLHVHPLEEVGRAAQAMSGHEPDDFEAAVSWLEISRIQSLYRERLQLQVDFVHREELQARPDDFFATAVRDSWDAAPLSQLVSPLVIEPDGHVVPLQYGFDRRYALGSLGDGSLLELGVAWRARYPAFLALCRRTLDALAAQASLPFVNWYRAVAGIAREELELDGSRMS